MKEDMNNEQILKKAIDKAVKNDKTKPKVTELFKSQLEDELSEYKIHSLGQYWWIFTKDFAKAFWGREKMGFFIQQVKQGEVIRRDTDWWSGEIWEYHLMIMVLEEEPLKYLAKFLLDKQ